MKKSVRTEVGEDLKPYLYAEAEESSSVVKRLSSTFKLLQLLQPVYLSAKPSSAALKLFLWSFDMPKGDTCASMSSRRLAEFHVCPQIFLYLNV